MKNMKKFLILSMLGLNTNTFSMIEETNTYKEEAYLNNFQENMDRIQEKIIIPPL
jgi:hypothetical protein